MIQYGRCGVARDDHEEHRWLSRPPVFFVVPEQLTVDRSALVQTHDVRLVRLDPSLTIAV